MRKAFIFTAFLAVTLFTAVTGNAQSAAGEWDGSFETPGGARGFKLTVTVDGEKVSGTLKRPNGEGPISGTVKGSDISFTYTLSYSGRDLTLSFTGKINGDAMSGAVSFGDSSGNAWSAKRVVAEKPKEPKQ